METPNKKAAPFFREEATEHNKSRVYGAVLIKDKFANDYLGATLLLITLIFVYSIFSFEHTRKQTVTGRLIAKSGIIYVRTSMSGTLVESGAKEGNFVTKGDTLFVIKNIQSSRSALNISEVKTKLLNSRVISLNEEIQDSRLYEVSQTERYLKQEVALSNTRANLLAEYDIQKKRVTYSSEELKRNEALYAKGFISDLYMQERYEKLLDQQQRLIGVKRQLEENTREMVAAQVEKAKVAFDASENRRKKLREIAEIKQYITETEGHSEDIITSSSDGEITSISAHIGQTVESNQIVASIIPAEIEIVAELDVPSSAMGFISSGGSVLLRYDSYPYQKFGQFRGQIIEVPKAPQVKNKEGSSESAYKVIVKLPSQSVQVGDDKVALKIGGRVEASILGENRRLYEWMFETFSINKIINAVK